MNFNATFIGQTIAFLFFLWFCRRYVWPLFAGVLEERRRRVADGLEAAARAQKDLELAQQSATGRMKEAKERAAEIVAQANRRAAQIVEEAKEQARGEGRRIIAGARAEIDQERNRAREALRSRVAELALAGAERILEGAVDRAANEEILDRLAREL